MKAETVETIDAIVDRVETVADRVVSLVIRRLDGRHFHDWDPGSHIDVHVGDGLVRQYSLCSSPDDLSHLRIGVLHTPDSRGGSRQVHETFAQGSPITISVPRNNFPLVDSRKYLFIAGGIGITPIIPMIEAAEREGREWRLVYGGRSHTTMAFAQQLLDRYGPERVAIAAEDASGRLDLEALLSLPRAHMLVYACGPSGMLNAIEEYCMGWPPGALHVERFVAAALDAGGSTEPFEVELVRTGTTIPVESGTTVLEAVESAGVRVLSSCRVGLCGTCETRVISGDIEHRDAVLTDADRDAGDVMLVCVSRAAAGCPRLVLDL